MRQTTEHPELQRFLKGLGDESPDLPVIDVLIPRLEELGLLEQAWLRMKHDRPRKGRQDSWQAVRGRLEAAVSRARVRRMSQWQMDPRRRTLRLRFEVLYPACDLNPSALQAALTRALVESGLPVAMGLEKNPRPAIHMGHPLPLGVEGLSEVADIILREPLSYPVDELAEHVNPYCPKGLRVIGAEPLSNHASPVLDLCREAHWAWSCPGEHCALARERLAQFEASTHFQIEKTGKIGGHKQVKRVDVRHLVLHTAWNDDTFCFTTAISSGEALNPAKLLAGVLGLEPAAIHGLTRLLVDLGEDPRLKVAHKYEPKLHNIFEDAVLLESGSNIRLVDDDDEDDGATILGER